MTPLPPLVGLTENVFSYLFCSRWINSQALHQPENLFVDVSCFRYWRRWFVERTTWHLETKSEYYYYQRYETFCKVKAKWQLESIYVTSVLVTVIGWYKNIIQDNSDVSFDLPQPASRDETWSAESWIFVLDPKSIFF